ncbi:putative reverse transcriptase domain-containing protein [Tanacetum coccineum]
MLNTNTNLQTQTSNALHNGIMENPPYKFKWAERTIPIAEGSSETTTKDNDIYSTFDAYPNACAMCKAIERLKQGESINVQDFETNLYQEFGKFTSRDGEKLKLYYSRFVTLVKQSQELKTVSYHKLYDIIERTPECLPSSKHVSLPQKFLNKPHKLLPETEEKEIDKLIALISLSFKKIYKPTNNNLITSSNTSRANQDNTPRINKGTRYDNQRAFNVVEAKENVGTQVVHQSGIQCYNCKEYGHVARECQKPKRAKDAAYHKEKMLLYAAGNYGPIFDVDPLQKVPNDDDNYNVFANDREHLEQPESVNVTYLKEHSDTNITTDSLDMSDNRRDVDQDEDEDLARERDLIAPLSEKNKNGEIDESKDCNKLLESSNKILVDKLKSEIKDFKNKNKCLESSSNHFKEANTKLAKNNQLMFKDLKRFQAKLDRYHDVNYASKVEIDCAKAKGDKLISYNYFF